MPRRPRQHQIEDVSRIEFRRLLPDAWVCRDIHPDYGLDLEVEIFAETGDGTGGSEATGHRFFVQVRATESDRLNVRIPIRHWLYYDAVDAPVLVARFHVPTNTMFVRWFHLARAPDTRPGQVGVSLKLEQSHSWTPATASGLVKEVALFRAVRSPLLQLPLLVDINVRTPRVANWKADDIARELAAGAATIPRILAVGGLPQPGAVRLAIDAATPATTITLSGCRAVTLETRRTASFGDLAGSILTLAGCAVSAAGHASAAAEVFRVATRTADVLTDPAIALQVASTLSRVGDWSLLLDLVEEALGASTDSSLVAAELLLTPAVADAVDLPQTVQRRLLKILAIWITAAKEAGEDPRITARLTAKLANTLFDLGRLKEAFRQCRSAMTLDESLLEEPRFLRIVGLTLCARRRYRVGLRFLWCSALRGNRLDAGFLGDALMAAGRYRDALAAYERAGGLDAPNPSWTLRAWALPRLTELAKIRSGRRPRAAAETFEQAIALPTDGERLTAMLAAGRLDLLNAEIWSEIGIAWSQYSIELQQCASEEAANARQLAFLSYLWAALISGDPATWAAAFAALLMFAVPDEPSFLNFAAPAVATAGYLAAGDAFRQRFHEWARDAMPDPRLQSDYFDVFERSLAVGLETREAKLRKEFGQNLDDELR
jgi:tetratricopeptide (TPR) repeat protein